MKILLCATLLLAGFTWFMPQQAINGSIDPYLSLINTAPNRVPQVINKIDEQWSGKSVAMLLEAARLTRPPSTRRQIFALLSKRTGQNFGDDAAKWERWMWKQPDEPDPLYPKFKARFYSLIDPRFSEYFTDTDNAKIRLDEIVWGGVRRDGIPPLDKPQMISAKEATYLDDSNEVFGVSINGDNRCYPKRILAWHEMFKDTVGGQSVCGAY